jgi:predicted Zn-dependent protease
MTRITAAHELVERARASRSDACVVIAEEESSANLRWAGNALTTNGVTRSRRLTVIAAVGGGQGTAAGVVSRQAVTADEVEAVVRAAEAAAWDAGPAEDAQPLVTPRQTAATSPSAGFSDDPAETSIAVFADFAPALGEALARSREGGRLLYGFARHEMTTTYLATSTGLRLRHDQPTGSVERQGRPT